MRNEGTIKRYSADELRAAAARGESRTDVARVKDMSDQDVERAIAGDADWQDVARDWFKRAEVVMPRSKEAISIRLDADVLDYFRAQGRGWQTRINAVLKAYMEAARRAG